MCKLIEELSKLKKSSFESVDTAETFNEFQKYMHVERHVENDLKKLLEKIKGNEKSLILLCGNVGDGKSHLLAYFKNQTSLLDGYKIINDATESKYPDKTSKQCLAEELIDFSDELLENGIESKIIIAINFGIIANFLSSKEGENYSKLKKYVEDAGLITTDFSEFGENNIFHNINFAHYHMYELNNHGVESVFLKDLIERVFKDDQDNVFYAAFKECKSLCKHKCPIYANYKLLTSDNAQNAIVDLLMKSIVSEKIILSTRAILNLIYDIIVAPEFENVSNVMNMVSKSKSVAKFIKASTPFLLFENKERSSLLEIVSVFDPVLERTFENDDLAISFNYSENLVELSNKGIVFNPYFAYVYNSKNTKSLYYEHNKYALNKLNIRLRKIEAGFIKNDKVFKNYLSALYSSNVGDKSGLRSIYEKFTKAIYKWDGVARNDKMIVPTMSAKYTISQEIDLKPDLSYVKERNQELLNIFKNSLIIQFNVERRNFVKIDVDYKLFELIDRIYSGYRPTINDKNIFVNFNEAVNKIAKSGQCTEKIFITENSPSGKTFSVSKGEFGFEFKEV